MEISLLQLFRLVRKNFLSIFLCAVLCAGAALGISSCVLPKTYVATVKLYVYTPESSENPAVNIDALNYAQRVVSTYIQMLQTNSFYGEVARQARYPGTVADLKRQVDFSSLDGTEVFQVQVSAHDPQEAKTLADSITALAPGTISSLKENSTLKVVDPAVLPEEPSSPSVPLCTAVGFILGAAVSCMAALLRQVFDVRIKGENDLAEKYDIPILASIPAFNKNFLKGK